MSCICEVPDSPGRIVRTSAVGSTWEALIPNARSSCGVATYSGPDQLRPDAACWGMALVESSSMTSWDPSAPAMLCAPAAMDRSWLPVVALPDPAPGPPGPYWSLGV
jgi:hypothetical protein